MRVLQEWLREYWERGHEDVALAQWSITARYAPEKADAYLAGLREELANAEPAQLAALVEEAGIDPSAGGDEDHGAWLRRVLGRFAEVLADQRP